MTSAQRSDDQQLAAFLQHRDEPCPVCGYNLRDLTGEVCPECRHHLRLTVGAHHVRFGWFLLTVTPSLFCGLCAVLLLAVILVSLAAGARPVPPGIYLIELLGFVSVAAALPLLIYRHRFIRLRPRVQRTAAFAAWAIHALPFLALLLLLYLTA